MVPYAELHCHSNASFLDGGSHPEELAEEAARLRLEALAITDHDGMYGIVRFAEAARALSLPTIFGAELTLPAERPSAPAPGPACPSVGCWYRAAPIFWDSVASRSVADLMAAAASVDGPERVRDLLP